MSQKFTLNDREYCFEKLSGTAKTQITSLQFVYERIEELTNMQALLQRAKNSYVDSIKKEMIEDKAGLLFIDD